MKKLSVIIPMFNVASLVFRAAESINSQAFDGLEVILVDDGSGDNSMDAALPLLKNVDVIEIRQKNAGLSAARNAGIEASTGEYLLFLDADDFLIENAFENILKLLEAEKPDVIFGRYLRWSPKAGFLPSEEYNYNPPSDPLSRTEYIISALPEPSWNAWRYICRKKTVTDASLYFEKGLLCEDVPWTLKMLDSVDTISFLQEPFYAYFHHRDGSIMNTLSAKRFVDLNKIVCSHLPLYENRPGIYRKLGFQSFFYINEYCLFTRQDRSLIWESYKNVFPLLAESPSFAQRIAAKFRNPIMFFGLSVCMFILRRVRRIILNMLKR